MSFSCWRCALLPSSGGDCLLSGALPLHVRLMNEMANRTPLPARLKRAAGPKARQSVPGDAYDNLLVIYRSCSRMLKVAVVVLVAASCLPDQAFSMFPSTNYYVDFIIAKNCFGEESALEMEKAGLKIGRKCWMEEWGNTFGFPTGQGARKKRNILKMPSTPSDRLLTCNLRGLNLLTEEDEMNYDTVNMWLDSKIKDASLRNQLLELSAECQSRPFTFAGLPMKKPIEPPLRGVLAFRTYMDCMNAGGTRICRDKEMRRLRKKMLAA